MPLYICLHSNSKSEGTHARLAKWPYSVKYRIAFDVLFHIDQQIYESNGIVDFIRKNSDDNGTSLSKLVHQIDAFRNTLTKLGFRDDLE